MKSRAVLVVLTGGLEMKKVAVAMALIVASLSLTGCFVGKGKAPAPVVTKG
jgi:hypothetical protein